MLDEIRDRVARFERALTAIAAHKPAGSHMTTEDEERAAWVADAVERFEARQKLARVKLPSPVVVMGAPDAPAAPRRPRRKRKARDVVRRRKPRAVPPVAQPAAVAQPKRRGRPRRIAAPSADVSGG